MMINTVLEHVPIKLENFQDDENSNNSNDCSAIWRASSSTSSQEAAAAAATISRTSSITTTTGNLELDDVIESCGNVFIYSRRKLFLICGFCDSKYANMLQFAKHLNDCHKIFYTHCEGEVLSNQSPPTNAPIIDDSDSDGTTTASSASATSSGVIVKGGFQIRFVGEGSTTTTTTVGNNDEESLPTTSDVLLQHVPIKVEDEQGIEDEKAMLDFENNIESCGNIFVMNRRKLFLICGFCEGKYANMELFASHLHECHTIFEEDDEANGSIHQPVQIKEEPEEVLVAVRRRPTANEISLPMVAIPTVGNEDIIPAPDPEVLPAATTDENSTAMVTIPTIENENIIFSLVPEDLPAGGATKRKRILMESRNERVSSKDSDDRSVESDLSEIIPANEEIFIDRGPKFYTCQTCSKQFKKLSRMLEHVRIHTGEKPHGCFECGKRFRIKLRLTEHMMRHREVKAYKCDICGLGCATRQDYSLHQRHHNGDKRYSCKECGKAFVRSGDLKTHLRIHTDERPYKCDICNNTFRANQNLIIHRRMHDPDKPFKCDFCDKKFRRKIDRKVHHRTHTGEKAFKCEICNRGYSAKVHVRRHIEKSHMSMSPTKSQDQSQSQEENDCQTKEKKSAKKEKPFKCTHCPKEYSGKSTMDKHIKKMHANPNDESTTKTTDDTSSMTIEIVSSPEITAADP